MSTWAALRSTDYITADEFDGKDVTITITRFEKKDFERDDKDTENGKKHKKIGVAYFKGSERGWVLNETNIQLLNAIFPTPEDAIGHRVTLRAEEVNFGREKVPGIRVIGSPELEAPIDVQVKLPRRKPVTRRLFPTGTDDAQPTLNDGQE